MLEILLLRRGRIQGCC